MRTKIILRLAYILLLAGLVISMGSCEEEVETRKVVRGYFGDKKGNTVKVVNVTDFTLEASVPTGHEVTYTADKIGSLNKLYVVNRGSNAIDVLDAKTMKITNTITLDHFPRSAESVNTKLGLVAVTGMNKGMVTIIDMVTDEVVATVGNPEVTFPVELNNTGSHACGHPFWLDKNHFILPDRGHNILETYKIENVEGTWVTSLLSSINTPSPIHQIFPSKGNYQGEASFFYASAEGISKQGADNVYPSVVEFYFSPDFGLIKRRELVFDDAPMVEMGLHHGDFHPTEKLIYVGSRQGTIYLIDYETMTLHSTIEAGLGIGHVKMIPSKNLAVAINHSDVFVTIIDLNTNQKIKDVVLSESTDLIGKTTLLAHPKWYVSEDGNKFYSFVTADGIFYELDLNSYEVTRTLDVGGEPAQGSFITLDL